MRVVWYYIRDDTNKFFFIELNLCIETAENIIPLNY